MSGNSERIKANLGIPIKRIRGVSGRLEMPIREEVVVLAIINERFYEGCPRCAKVVRNGVCVGLCGPVELSIQYIWRDCNVSNVDIYFTLTAAHRFPRLKVGGIYNVSYVRAPNDNGFLVGINN